MNRVHLAAKILATQMVVSDSRVSAWPNLLHKLCSVSLHPLCFRNANRLG